jgi:hypothetical protein
MAWSREQRSAIVSSCVKSTRLFARNECMNDWCTAPSASLRNALPLHQQRVYVEAVRVERHVRRTGERVVRGDEQQVDVGFGPHLVVRQAAARIAARIDRSCRSCGTRASSAAANVSRAEAFIYGREG